MFRHLRPVGVELHGLQGDPGNSGQVLVRQQQAELHGVHHGAQRAVQLVHVQRRLAVAQPQLQDEGAFVKTVFLQQLAADGVQVFLVDGQQYLGVGIQRCRVESAFGAHQVENLVRQFAGLPFQFYGFQHRGLVGLDHQVDVAGQGHARALVHLPDEAQGMVVHLAHGLAHVLAHGHHGGPVGADAGVTFAQLLQGVDGGGQQARLAVVDLPDLLGQGGPLGAVGL